jgi:hypothetical protein
MKMATNYVKLQSENNKKDDLCNAYKKEINELKKKLDELMLNLN